MLVVRTHDIEESCGIVADLLAQLPQSHELARACRHRELVLATVQRDELHELDLEIVARVAHALETRTQARHVAVMIGAEDVDQVIEAAFAFLVMIGNVGSEVGLRAVLANDDTVFLVAKIRCLEPRGAISLVEHVTLFEHRECLVDCITPGETLFGVPAIEGHAEFPKIVFDVVANRVERLLADVIKTGVAQQGFRLFDQRFDIGFLIALRSVGWQARKQRFAGNSGNTAGVDCCRDVTNIAATIAALRKRNGNAVGLEQA